MTDFSDRPFVAGSLVGLRAFAVDRLGRLSGPSFGQVFRPGENAAACLKADGALYPGGLLTSSIMSSYYSSFGIPSWMMTAGGGDVTSERDKAEKRLSEAAVEAPAPPPHVLAGVRCSCGFYAYFDGGNDFKDSNRVTAIIEGYGVCTVGARGFRAEKARLVALAAPGRRFPVGRFELVQRNYPGVPVYDRKRDALAAHPLTVEAVPTPEDDDFWTRPVAS